MRKRTCQEESDDIDVLKGENVFTGETFHGFPKAILFDCFSLLETVFLLHLGIDYIVGENFNKWPFVMVMILLHCSGLLLKGSYYIYCHPFTEIKNTLKNVHVCLCALLILALLVVVPMLTSSVVIKTLVVCFATLLILSLMVSIICMKGLT